MEWIDISKIEKEIQAMELEPPTNCPLSEEETLQIMEEVAIEMKPVLNQIELDVERELSEMRHVCEQVSKYDVEIRSILTIYDIRVN